jgi:hypothetical protein
MDTKYRVNAMIFLGCFMFCISFGQNSDAPKAISNTILIKNCFLVKQPGQILPNQDILIKDGFIKQTGPSLKAPFDAQIIKADSLYVYAGFIDAYSNTGIPRPETKERPKVAIPGSPPNDVAGITPQYHAIDFFKQGDKSVEDMRNAGFTVSQIVPRGLMLPGYSSIILLGDGPQDKLILRGESAQNLQLEASRGVFPSTTIGVISKFRDLYRNASLSGQHEEKFLQNPTGLQRPEYLREWKALYPVTNGKKSLYFVAPKTKDVHKALSLKDELGFTMVLTEVKQGWHYLDKIKSSNTAVLLSLELPEEEKKEEAKGGKTGAAKDSVDVKEKKSEPPIDPEKKLFDEKQQKSVQEYVSQAAVFEKATVPFGFSFMNVKSGDIRKNILRMVKAGLSENSALAALTTNPAKILGLSHLIGTIEPGKLGNLVVTDKPYFDEKASLKMVFVDGKKYEFAQKPKKGDSKPSDEPKISGSWSYTVEIPGVTQKGKMKIQKKGGALSVKVTSDDAPEKENEGQDVSLSGNRMNFHIITEMGQSVKVDFDLTFEDKSYSGSVSVGQFGSFPVKGDFEGNPDNQ